MGLGHFLLFPSSGILHVVQIDSNLPLPDVEETGLFGVHVGGSFRHDPRDRIGLFSLSGPAQLESGRGRHVDQLRLCGAGHFEYVYTT